MEYRIDYYAVISQANSIENDAAQLSAQFSQLENMEGELNSAYKCPAASVFLSKLTALRQGAQRTQREMYNLSASIKSIAEQIRREDEEKARRAEKLT